MVWHKQFGNIPSQPRYKRRIDCFWDSVNKMYLPVIDSKKHRFTLYQAHLNTNQLNRIKNNNFTNQSCGLCNVKGHARNYCWINQDGFSAYPDWNDRIPGITIQDFHDRFILYYIGRTAVLASRSCWSDHMNDGGSIGLEYLWDVNADGNRSNIRVSVFKMDKDNRLCRCKKCHEYFGKHIQQFSPEVQEKYQGTTAIDTDELTYMDDTEIRNLLKNVDIKTDGSCPICMEELLDVDKVVTKCGHVFCASCLFQNMGTSTACPMCRENLADFRPINDKITVLEQELDLLRQELHQRQRTLRRLVTIARENI